MITGSVVAIPKKKRGAIATNQTHHETSKAKPRIFWWGERAA
jgi:hypothetical protein